MTRRQHAQLVDAHRRLRREDKERGHYASRSHVQYRKVKESNILLDALLLAVVMLLFVITVAVLSSRWAITPP